MSPSSSVWVGLSARARPSWAVVAIRRARAGSRAALVATTASVVFAAGGGGAGSAGGVSHAASAAASSGWGSRGRGSPRGTANVPSSAPVTGSTGLPSAFTTAIAPTTSPPGNRTLAVPIPPLRRPAASTVPVPAPMQPRAVPAGGFSGVPAAKGFVGVPAGAGLLPAAWAARRPRAASGRAWASPPRARSKTAAAGTIGTTMLCRSGGGPAGNPRPACSHQACTPPAAASPNALPPVRHTASTVGTRVVGSRASVSWVPGPPPRTSTAPTVPGGGSTTVTPVSHPSPTRCAWPTCTCGTSVIAPYQPPAAALTGAGYRR